MSPTEFPLNVLMPFTMVGGSEHSAAGKRNANIEQVFEQMYRKNTTFTSILCLCRGQGWSWTRFNWIHPCKTVYMQVLNYLLADP